jgi:hypothetical protein
MTVELGAMTTKNQLPTKPNLGYRTNAYTVNKRRAKTARKKGHALAREYPVKGP